MTQAFYPEDKQTWLKLRAEDVTSTEIAALFHCSPYLTQFELAHRKRQKLVVEIEESERMKWGSRLENAIAQGIAEDLGLNIRPMKEYVRDPSYRLGASFDYAIGEDGILEIKNVDTLQFKDGWLIHGDTIEAPPHIELQVQQQLALSGRKFAMIGALIGGNRVKVIQREPNPAVIEAIRKQASAFWEKIQRGEEFPPSFPEDADLVCKLNGIATPGTVIQATSEIEALAKEYKAYSDAEKTAIEGKKTAKANILKVIQDAEKVKGDQFSISAGMIGPKMIAAQERSAYRDFRITWKKG